jgi:hypothetical protein
VDVRDADGGASGYPGARPRARGWCGQAGGRDLVERRNHSLQGLDGAGHEGRLGLGNRIVDRDSRTFVQDLDAEDLGGTHGTVLVGTRQGDIERQYLIAVAGERKRPFAIQIGDRGVLELVDGRCDGCAVAAHDVGRKQRVGVGSIENVLRANLVDVGFQRFGSGELSPTLDTLFNPAGPLDGPRFRSIMSI